MENIPRVSRDPIAKRKQGRPRKHQKTESDVQSIGSSLGFSLTEPQIRQGDEDEAMVGQPIHGVIEATFEAGFLLAIKFENSDTMFRGVVFKPGHCDPVSVDNDVAPYLPMIRRNSEVVPPNPTHLQNGGGRVPVNRDPMHTETGSQVQQTIHSTEAAEEQTLSTEPLQGVHYVHMPSYGRGNMTELLQENVKEPHFAEDQ